MSLITIIKKELKELLTPTTILPVLILSLVFGSMGNMIGGIEEEITEDPLIGYISQDTGHYAQVATSFLKEHSKVVYNGSDIKEGIAQVQDKNGAALIIIPLGFSDDIMANTPGVIEVHWIMEGAGIMDSISS